MCLSNRNMFFCFCGRPEEGLQAGAVVTHDLELINEAEVTDRLVLGAGCEVSRC